MQNLAVTRSTERVKQTQVKIQKAISKLIKEFNACSTGDPSLAKAYVLSLVSKAVEPELRSEKDMLVKRVLAKEEIFHQDILLEVSKRKTPPSYDMKGFEKDYPEAYAILKEGYTKQGTCHVVSMKSK